ncbi:MAG: glycerol-3-phosphate 1-O-acyltransferase PlsY [Cytophagales bacterium]
MFVFIIIGCAIAYLLGSIPTAVWYGRFHHGIDIRNYGSGNAGATNTFRVLGKRAGAIVMAVDMLKGWLATSMAFGFNHFGLISDHNTIYCQLVFGMIAVLGHVFPVFAEFKGGKGIATLMGMVLSIHIYAALICLGVFLLVFLTSHYVSLGSMIASLAYPVIMLIPAFSPDEPIVLVFGFVIFVLVVLTHRKNVRRLLNGEENKIYLKRRS